LLVDHNPSPTSFKPPKSPAISSQTKTTLKLKTSPIKQPVALRRSRSNSASSHRTSKFISQSITPITVDQNLESQSTSLVYKSISDQKNLSKDEKTSSLNHYSNVSSRPSSMYTKVFSDDEISAVSSINKSSLNRKSNLRRSFLNLFRKKPKKKE